MLQGGSQKATAIFREALLRKYGCCGRGARTRSRSPRGAIEAVIPATRPDMLHAITSGDFHGRIGPSSRMTNGNPKLLHVAGLTKSYRTAGEQVAVLRGVNLV